MITLATAILAVSVIRVMLSIALVVIVAGGLIWLIMWAPFIASGMVKKVGCWVIAAIAIICIVFYLLQVTGLLDGGHDMQVPNLNR